MYWCFDCGSSLAEFEIEYADRNSTAVDVAFLADDRAALAAAFGLESIDQDAFAVIWTTTPWTIPANQALNLNPRLEYSLVATERGALVLASALVDKCLARYGLEGRALASTLGTRLEGLRFPPSARRRRPGLRPHRAGPTSPTTRPPTKAPASSTRRPRTASTTSTPAVRTA